jgi:hypothetical protein
MRRDTFKLLVFAGIVAFAVLFGMELSSKGIENVNGPWPTTSQTSEQKTTSVDDWSLPTPEPAQVNKTKAAETQKPVDNTPYYDWDKEEFGIPRYDRKPIVDRVSGKTAQVLHDLSRSGIRLVVSIFDRVTG